MNTKRLQYFLLGVLVTIAGSVSADSIFGGGGSGGGAATSISGNGGTVITNGTNTAIFYDDSGTAKADATSPTWAKATGKLTATGLAASADGDVTNPALRLNQWRWVGNAAGNVAYLFNFANDPTDTGGFEFRENTADTFFSWFSPDGTQSGHLIATNSGTTMISSDGDLGLASDEPIPQWQIHLGNLASVGAGRNITLSGILTAGTGPTTVTNAAGKVLNAALASPPRATFGGQTGLGVLGATMLGGMYKPTVGVTLTRISGQVILAGTCAACGVTDTTFRVTDGSTNSDCLNASAILCTAAAGAKFNCTPSNVSRAADQELTVETVSVGGTCTTAPVVALTVEYGLQ